MLSKSTEKPDAPNESSNPEVSQNRVAWLSRASCGASMKASTRTDWPSADRRGVSNRPTSTPRNSTGEPYEMVVPSSVASVIRRPGRPGWFTGGESEPSNSRRSGPGTLSQAPSM